MAEDGTPQEGKDTGSAGRPDFLLDKFASVEDQARSVSEATREMHEARTERNRIAAEMDELRSEFDQITDLVAQQAAPQQYQDPNQHPLVRQYAEAYENGDAAQMLAVQAQLTQAVIQEQLQAQQQQSNQQPDETLAVISTVAEDQLRKTYPDYDTVRDRVVEKLNQFPGLVPDQTLTGVRTGIETAYKLVTGETLMQQQQDSAAQAAAAEAERQQKLAATGLMGGGSRQAPVDEAHQHMQDLINMRSGTFSELLNDARK